MNINPVLACVFECDEPEHVPDYDCECSIQEREAAGCDPLASYNRVPVELDPTADDCTLILRCTGNQAEILQSVAGCMIEVCEGCGCAIIGVGWSDAHTDAENDAESDHVLREVVKEIEAAGLTWVEV